MQDGETRFETTKRNYGDDESVHCLANGVLFGLTKYSFDDEVSLRKIFHPDSWKGRAPPSVARFVIFRSNPGAYVSQIELRYEDGNYIWWMQCTKRFEGKEFYYRNDLFTFLVLHAFVSIYTKEVDKEKIEDGEDGEDDETKEKETTRPSENKTYLANATTSLKKFLEDSMFSIPDYPDLTAPIVLLYAIFYDQEKWDYKDSKSGDDSDSDYDSYHDFEKYGYCKTVTIGTCEETVYYVSGSHLLAKNSSYGDSMRSAMDKYITGE